MKKILIGLDLLVMRSLTVGRDQYGELPRATGYAAYENGAYVGNGERPSSSGAYSGPLIPLLAHMASVVTIGEANQTITHILIVS